MIVKLQADPRTLYLGLLLLRRKQSDDPAGKTECSDETPWHQDNGLIFGILFAANRFDVTVDDVSSIEGGVCE